MKKIKMFWNKLSNNTKDNIVYVIGLALFSNTILFASSKPAINYIALNLSIIIALAVVLAHEVL